MHVVMAAVPWGHSIHKKASKASIQVGGAESKNSGSGKGAGEERELVPVVLTNCLGFPGTIWDF